MVIDDCHRGQTRPRADRSHLTTTPLMNADMHIGAALLAGLVSSVHCAGMCGPLACGLGTKPQNEMERYQAISAYHMTRLTAYAVVGAVCGAIGQQPLQWAFDSPLVLLPWALVALLLVVALGWHRHLPRPAVLNRFLFRTRLRLQRFSALGQAIGLGAITPMLPCAPLYGLFALCLMSGNAERGAELSFSFGLGTIPLLWAAQWGWQRSTKRLQGATLRRMQSGLAIIAALTIAWRLQDTLPWKNAPQAVKELPSCCHENHE